MVCTLLEFEIAYKCSPYSNYEWIHVDNGATERIPFIQNLETS